MALADFIPVIAVFIASAVTTFSDLLTAAEGRNQASGLLPSCSSYARSFRQRFLLIRRTLTGGVKVPGCQRRQACVWIVFALLNGILTCLGRR